MDQIRGLRPKHGGIEIRYTYRGTTHSHFFNKPYNRTNCAEASRLRRQLIDGARDAVNTDHLRKENPAFISVAQDYLDALRGRATTSYINQVKRDINTIWLPLLGALQIKDIRVRDVRLADQQHPWPSAKRQQNARSILRGIFASAIMDELIDSNPAEKLLGTKHQAPPIDPFSKHEKEAILGKLSGQSYLFYLLAFEAGLRTAELMGLQWSDIRDDKIHLERTLVLRQYKDMKTKECRSVALTTRAIAALEATPHHPSGYLWINSVDGHLTDNKTLTKHWKKAIAVAGVRYRRPYTCRHTRASLGLSAGQTPAWLANQLGHDMRTFFAKYATFIGGNTDAVELAKLEHSAKTELGQTGDN